VESKIVFGQLILRNIIKTVATRCQILRLKCTKIQNSAGAQPQTPLGELTALPDSYLDLTGPTSKGRGGEWRMGWECCGIQKILKIDPELTTCFKSIDDEQTSYYI